MKIMLVLESWESFVSNSGRKNPYLSNVPCL